MKILLAIAFHGTKNRPYLDRVLAEYRAMPFEVDFVIFSETPKDLGPDVKVLVGAPTDDPWSLPFGHKAYFAERLNDYDLFIYSEDDILIAERNIRAFMEAQAVLPPEEIPGFLRTEQTSRGRVSFPEAHGYFHWIPGSLRRRGNFDFAAFSNDHAGCYILTRAHLKKAIDSGGFLVPPHDHRYDLLVTAATDPYTQCGMRKLICLSRIDDFIVPHLSNRYAGVYGLEAGEMRLQIDEMLSHGTRAAFTAELIATETRLPRLIWSKTYYEPVRADMLCLMPTGAKRILSIGCGTGQTEAHLVEQGCSVTAVPLDSIIGAVAKNKGVDIVPANLNAAKIQLLNQRFDCILCASILHLCADPVSLLKSAADWLADDGVLLVSVPNPNHHRALLPRLKGKPGYRDIGNFPSVGVHKAGRRQIRRWFAQAGLVMGRSSYNVPDRHRWLRVLAGPLGRELTALDVTHSARRARPAKARLAEARLSEARAAEARPAKSLTAAGS